LAEEEKIKFVSGYQCMFCGEIYPEKTQAEKCWLNHTQFIADYVFEMGEEFPTEVIVKKIEGPTVIEIGTYELKEKKKVNFPYKVEKKIE
jgi:hypothetical protein